MVLWGKEERGQRLNRIFHANESQRSDGMTIKISGDSILLFTDQQRSQR